MTEKTNWSIDPGHSEVQFKVKHLAISNVAGTFKNFRGTVETTQNDFKDAGIHFEIVTDSIDTNNSERDKHLRSDLFFDVQKYPLMFFDGALRKNEEDYLLEGTLELCGVKKNMSFPAEFSGIGKGRFGDERAGFEVNGKINRKDFGLNFSLLTEAGNLVVGEDVKLHFDIQLIKQA